MQIDLDLLYSNGAVVKEYQKGEEIFHEGSSALFYFQIIEGCVKMFNTNDNGKEFTQGYFFNGQSFGEPPLFIEEKYPATANAHLDTTVVKLPKDKFLEILAVHPEIQSKFLILMARRIHAKAQTSKDIINQNSSFRILAFLKALTKAKKSGQILVPYTRQEIANFTGLRVETVIRTLAKLHEEKIIEIKNHKVYY